MWSKVEQYIKKHKLLDDSKLYVVALSGGADSVALLILLDEMGYKIEAAHCNFRLRGAESEHDESFCERLCQERNIPFHRVHFDTKTYAEVHKVSIELAARELRYQWFEELRKDIGAAGVCVAHHRDDSVETLLMNLVRGTGLRGLCGIQPRNGYVLRPLLAVSRQEIETFLTDRGQAYVTDSTNLETDATRNKVRLQVIPMLKDLNPAVAENIQRTAENLTEAQKTLDVVMERYKNRNKLDLNELNGFGSCEYIVFEWLKNYGFNGSQMKQIMKAETGRLFTSPKGYDLLVNRGSLLVEPSLKPTKPLVVPEEGTYVIDGSAKFVVKTEQAWISKESDVATVDASKVAFPLTVRRVEEGDWMIPYGMKGRKLLSDLMTDCKLSLFEKRRQLVVTDARGAVIWLVGHRTDNRCRVDSGTSRVLALRIILSSSLL